MKPPSKKLRLLCRFSAHKKNQSVYATAIKRMEGMLAAYERRRERVDYEVVISWLTNIVVVAMVVEYQQAHHNITYDLSPTDYRTACKNIAPLLIAKFPDVIVAPKPSVVRRRRANPSRRVRNNGL
jgi:hypothetical protein